MRIDRCYCFATTFAALREVAEATGAETVSELQAHAVFGRRCRLCHPYVRRMLRTGATSFGEIVTEADEPADRPADEPADEPPGAAERRAW